MSRRDKYHENLRIALERDGWDVTHDPYVLKIPGQNGKIRHYPVDIGAEKLLAAKKGKNLIAVEIKTFGGSSVIHDYHLALGQYMDYLAGLEVQEPERKLFLAITEKAYQGILENPLANLSLKRFKIQVIIFDQVKNVIIKWIK